MNETNFKIIFEDKANKMFILVFFFNNTKLQFVFLSD